MASLKTKYPCVYKTETGDIFYHVELGVDSLTGKRIQKKGRKNEDGIKFTTLKECNDYVLKLKNEHVDSGVVCNHGLTLKSMIDTYFLPYYKGAVQETTFNTKRHLVKIILDYFKKIKLNEITVRDCELFRVYLLGKNEYSQSYCSLIYGFFRQILDYAVTLNFLKDNISKKTKAIPKGKVDIAFWTKEEFEKVISTIYIDSFYEHMCFVILWLYFNTGIRVGEGQALDWSKINFKKKKMSIKNTLIMKNQKDYWIKPSTKTDAGIRIISLDDDTIEILINWKKRQEEHGITNLIFSHNDLPIGRNTIQRIIRRYAKLANVHPIQAKGLRHSHVSYLINEFNADILMVSQRLGHSSPDITLKHYGHLWARGDLHIAKMMTGNIDFVTSQTSKIKFNGNQAINPTKTLPK